MNREAAKISAFSSGKMDNHEYLTVKEILPSNYRRCKVYLFSFGKSFRKNKQKKLKMQLKTKKNDRDEKQIVNTHQKLKSISNLNSKDFLLKKLELN